MSLCLLASVLTLQPVQAQRLNLHFDYATFRYDSIRTYTELYYSFSSSSLHFVRVPAKDSAGEFSFSDSLLFNASILSVNSDSTVRKQIWEVPVTVPDTTAKSIQQDLVGKIDFVIPPGKYRLIVKIKEVNDSLNNDRLAADFSIPGYDTQKFELSEIELCSTITPAENVGIFYKNTYNVVPNPTSTYGLGMPIIYYYLEVYNIPEIKTDSLFTAGYEIRDSFGQVRKSAYRSRKKFGSSSVEVGTVNGSDLKTGSYTLVYSLIDSAANLYTSASKKFFIYNPSLGTPEIPDSNITSGAVMSSVFGMMQEQQLDKEFAEAGYIATSSEKNQYERLSGIGPKRQFLYDFWRNRDLDAPSKNNVGRTDYIKRVAYANENFRAGTREGWQTDRGRVYIMYGNPDEIDRHPNETDSKPYEIWSYDSLEGGVSFDFIDRTGFGDYSLVNSTERNEIHDDNWQQYLSQ